MARINSSGTGGVIESGSGTVIGIPPTTIDAIATWANISGTIIQNSLALVQAGGGIEAQAFISEREIVNEVVINSGESWIAPSIQLELSGSIELEPDGEIIIV